MHNTPSFYVEYTKNWLATQKDLNPAERMIIEDITTLVKIAADHLEPEPADPVNKS